MTRTRKQPKASTRNGHTEAPALRLEWRSPAELTENPRNWRTHPQAQISALTDALAEVGWAGACLYNEATGRLIDGHARKKVALEQGTDQVPVLVGSWTEEQEKKILATLDPLSAMAEADKERLDTLLREVSTPSAALSQMLTELAERSGILPALPTPGAGGDEFDTQAAEQGPCRVQAGELWLIDGGKHRVLCGDSTKVEDVEKVMGGEKAFLMVTDPPYGVEYDPEWRDDAAKEGAKIGAWGKSIHIAPVLGDTTVDWSLTWKLFAGDVAYCWHAGRHASNVQQQFVSAGFEIRSQIVWRKQRMVISRGHYHWQHEPCWYAVRKGCSAKWTGDRSQTTVWEIASKDDASDTAHGTQKPIECMARPIRNHGAEGDIVYDPFLGSGTTLIAAHRLNRRCFGIEISPRYCEVILRRCEAEGLAVEKAG